MHYYFYRTAQIIERDEEIQALKEQIRLLMEENRFLRERVAELERQLKMSSNNSSKPPSTDSFNKPSRKQSLRQTGKNPSGGQRGHKGSTLQQSETPDETVVHTLSICPECDADLSEIAGTVSQRRQEFEIPAPQIKIVEHQVLSKTCPCCKAKVEALFPEGINAPVQYGTNVKAYAAYLATEQFIPEDRLQALFRDLFGLSIATHTLVGFNKKLHENLAGFQQFCLEKLRVSGLCHLDETGYRIAGKMTWLHTCSNQEWTYYHGSPKRKSLLMGLTGVVVHDHWKSYFQLPGVKHSLCNAHHLRELNARIEEDESWASALKDLLLKLCHEKHEHEGVVPAKVRHWGWGLYDKLITKGLTYHERLSPYKPKEKGRPARRKGHNLLIRLRDYKEDILRFMADPTVPFTNNQAERDLRMMKVKQKISGGFRTQEGADVFIRIRSYISTLKKQDLNVFESIKLAMCGQMPALI